MAPLVLVAGALHYDVLVRADRLPGLDETLRGRSVSYVCGGKGGNQAVAAARVAPTAMLGRVGDDHAGQVLLANLDAAGADRTGVAVAAGEASGMSVAIVNESGDYGAVIVSAANLGLDVADAAIPESVRVVLLQNEIPEAANLTLAERARAAGARVFLNAAPARPFETALRSLVDVLIVNRVEAAGLWGRAVATPADALAAAQALATEGPVIVTLGAEGAVLADAGEPRLFPAPPVEVVSSHGAGDAFAGTLAAHIALGAEIEEAVREAQIEAARHVARA